jgi:DNA-binding transcriptional ArsR family regulator
MAEKSFVMVSLKEDKAKKLTQTLSNETCRNILDYLSSRKEATESQISKDLKIPISTVHYNLKQLSETKLVTMDEFHYSEKGKEVIHYKIANKYIIIAPDEDEGFLERLKSFIPSFIIVGAVSVGLYIYQTLSKTAASGADLAMNAERGLMKVAVDSTQDVGAAAGTGLTEEASSFAASAPAAMTQSAQSAPADIALWFFVGAIFTMLVFLLRELYRHKRKN